MIDCFFRYFYFSDAVIPLEVGSIIICIPKAELHIRKHTEFFHGICLVCDLSISGTMEWSGYVVGALLIIYGAFLMPRWFEHPNPVIFVPSVFGLIAAFLLYISWNTGGSWFLTFGLPITGALGLLFTALITLCRYIRRGRLYIFGGFTIALGAFCVLLEILLHITFGLPGFGTWSLYPLSTLTLVGLAMIATAIFRPLREAVEKRFFL